MKTAECQLVRSKPISPCDHVNTWVQPWCTIFLPMIARRIIRIGRDRVFLALLDAALTSVTIGRLQPPSQPWLSKSRIDRILFHIGNGLHPDEHLQ